MRIFSRLIAAATLAALPLAAATPAFSAPVAGPATARTIMAQPGAAVVGAVDSVIPTNARAARSVGHHKNFDGDGDGFFGGGGGFGGLGLDLFLGFGVLIGVVALTIGSSSQGQQVSP